MQHTLPIQPLLCRDLVSRERELEQLSEAWHRATSGCTQFVLLSSEAGLGKTRLCRAFFQSKQVHPALRFWGRALPQSQAIPFGPFLDAFRRSLDSSASPLLLPDQSLVPSFAFLVHLLPELAGRFPDLATSRQDDLPAPAWRQQVFFHDILLGLQVLTRLYQQPLVLVMEDLQWADETSLELLTYLARRLDVNSTSSEGSPPLLILGTYCSEMLAESPALQRMLWHLRAQRHVTELHLAPLGMIDHRRIVSSILDQAVPEEFSDFLFQWDEGNPFYTEELLGTMAVTGYLQVNPHVQGWFFPQQDRPPLPSSITAAILERFVRLPPLDQEVLTMAAVIGRTFDFLLLVEVCDLDERTLADVLSRAIRRQFLSEITSTTSLGSAQPVSVHYHFRHALIRETVYDRLHTAACRLGHRTVAQTIERLHTRPPALGSATLSSLDHVAPLLATHYQLAGLLDRARPYALQAAQRASELCAFREERYYLDLAQASLPEESRERLALLERLGMLSMAVYDFEGALQWLTLALTWYERLGQILEASRVLVHMLQPQWFLARRSLPALIARIETEVERLFAEAEHVSQNVEVLTIVAHLALYWGSQAHLRRASYWIEVSESLYAAVSDPRKEDAFQVSIIARGYVKAHQQATLAQEGIAEVRTVLRYAHQQSLLDVLMFGYGYLGTVLLFRGDLDGTEQVFQEAILHERRSGMLHPCFVRGWHHFFSGQWKEGIQLLRRSVERLEQANIVMLSAVEGTVLAHILLACNNPLEAQTLLQRAQSFLEPLQQQTFLLWMEWGFAKLLTAQGNQSQAQQWYERLLQHWRTTDDALLIPPMLLDGISFYVQNHHVTLAHHWLEALRSAVTVSNTSIGVAALLEAEGVVAVAKGAFQQAIQKFKEALEAWSSLKWRYRQAEVSLQLAALLLQWAGRSTVNRLARQKAREEAEMLLESARSLYECLQVPTGLEQVQAMRSCTGIDVQRKRRKTLADRHSPGGLTLKETQALALLVAGKTNKEIAEQLNIAVGTVELHVTHILTKLNCETRTQAVTKAISQGLVTMQNNEGQSY